jgi:uncharacterized protein YceH (UPF0502 family)
VAELERRPGQKERRWIHLLGPVAERADDPEPTPAEPMVTDPADGWLLVRVTAADAERVAQAAAKALARPVTVEPRTPDEVLDTLTAGDDRLYVIA